MPTLPIVRRRSILMGAAAAAIGGLAHARFPERPITIVDPATPGSSTDLISRALAQDLSAVLGQPVVVDNRPGAAGMLATEFVARSRPDGYTLGLAAVSTHAASPALHRTLRYDPLRDFAPISMLVTLPSATVVSVASPHRTLHALIAAARANPGTISFASPGVGSAGHILLEHFSYLTGTKFLHVPYRGSTAMFTDLLGGQLAVVSDNITSVLPHIHSGRLRALAVRDTQRIAALPDVPIFRELGFNEVSYPLWFGLVAPAGTPRDIIEELNAAIHLAMRQPAFLQRATDGAATPAPGSPEQFQAEIEQWLTRFRAIVDRAGLATS